VCLLLVAGALASKAPEDAKKQDKRGLFGLGYGYGAGFGYGADFGHIGFGGIDTLATTVEITKHVPYPVPHPVPYTVERKVNNSFYIIVEVA
jgi:hypothetical protein